MKKFSLFIYFFICIIFLSERVYAASASVELIGEHTATVGDEIDVRLVVDSDKILSGIETYLSYTDKICEFISSDTNIAGSKGLLRVNINKDLETGDVREYNLRFRALKKGIFKLSFSDKVNLYTYETDDNLSISTRELEINIKNKREVSKNSSLLNLKVAKWELIPKFSKSILDYSVTVDSSTEKLIIGADPQDENSKVSVFGNDRLNSGNNEVKIVVQAEDGSSTTYRIEVFRKDEANQSKEGEESPEENLENIKSSENIESTKEEISKIIEPSPKEEVKKTETGKELIFYGIIIIFTIVCIILIIDRWRKNAGKIH